MPSNEPGWYPDPDPSSASGSLRWWGGSAWTDQVQPASARSTSPEQQDASSAGSSLPAATPLAAPWFPASYTGSSPEDGPPRRSSRLRRTAGRVSLVLVVVFVGVQLREPPLRPELVAAEQPPGGTEAPPDEVEAEVEVEVEVEEQSPEQALVGVLLALGDADSSPGVISEAGDEEFATWHATRLEAFVTAGFSFELITDPVAVSEGDLSATLGLLDAETGRLVRAATVRFTRDGDELWVLTKWPDL